MHPLPAGLPGPRQHRQRTLFRPGHRSQAQERRVQHRADHVLRAVHRLRDPVEYTAEEAESARVVERLYVFLWAGVYLSGLGDELWGFVDYEVLFGGF